MKTIGMKVRDEEIEALEQYCAEQNMTKSDLIRNALDKFLQGKVKVDLRKKYSPVSGQCPDCGSRIFYAPDAVVSFSIDRHDYSQLVRHKRVTGLPDGPYIFCIHCGWFTHIELPKKWHEGKPVQPFKVT